MNPSLTLMPKVPSINVSVLGLAPQKTSEPGTPLAMSVLRDIVRAEVTLVSTGLSQYSITFNNWLLTLPGDPTPATTGNAIATGQPPTQSGAPGGPTWPRFKYDDFAILAFGQRLRIDMRYWPGESTTDTTPPPNNWSALVSGPITDMRFSFGSGQGAQVTVAGEDDLSTLKDKQKDPVKLRRAAEVNIVQEIINEKANLNLNIATPKITPPPFTTNNANGIQEGLRSGQCWMDLINKFADRLDFEAFAEFADPPATPPTPSPPPAGSPSSGSSTQWTPPPLEFHFEPYRGRVPYDTNLRSIYRIDRQRNMLDFSPTIKVDDMATTSEVRGRHRDPQQGTEVIGTATSAIVQDELQYDPALDIQPSTAGVVRTAFFKNRQSWQVTQNQTNLDPDRAAANAEAEMRKKSRELFSIDVTAVGDPRIRPGRMVEIRGMRPPFDGFYYIKKVVHTYGTDGLRTKITACRPGMPMPPTIGIANTPTGSS